MIHIEGEFYLSDDHLSLNLKTDGGFIAFKIKADFDKDVWIPLRLDSGEFSTEQLDAIQAFLKAGGANKGRTIAWKGKLEAIVSRAK